MRQFLPLIALIWILRDTGKALHVTEMQNDQKLADFECNTVGRERLTPSIWCGEHNP